EIRRLVREMQEEEEEKTSFGINEAKEEEVEEEEEAAVESDEDISQILAARDEELASRRTRMTQEPIELKSLTEAQATRKLRELQEEYKSLGNSMRDRARKDELMLEARSLTNMRNSLRQGKKGILSTKVE